ncbi:DUF6506 family protein [Actinophytocola algeriensis]|uniref:Uncharacterized protein n=1 Tax=Actinophytocola algeriensis TaxID=1768010 RepID=A0A7W7VE36_9PSEU|nr:DUF6506 family protein [Actinophytocola algeriensis]MBB4906719.1 hypothetical protein [Actinophytocola algeriensis]MBE1478200.1 hypothetical protein [Actinophytocola algeriensis]
MFRNLFLVLVSEPAERVVHADDLSSTTIVPVTSAEEGAAVAAASEWDLVELYGGLGLDAAAAVVAALVDAAPGVPVGFPGDVGPSPSPVVLFEDPAADQEKHRWRFGSTTVIAVPSTDEVPALAARLAEEGATRIELCGGMGPVPAAAVRAVVDVPVTTVLFGFESLPSAAAYRARFEASLTTHD